MSGLANAMKDMRKNLQRKDKIIERLKKRISALNRTRTRLNGTISDLRQTISDLNGTDTDFLWGAASASFQIEGTPTGNSIWDKFCINKMYPYPLPNGTDPIGPLEANVSCNSFYEYEKDVAALVEMGLNAYRLSISWSRLFPTGRGLADEAGVNYYKTVFDLLKKNGIEPIVTLFHWDLPSVFQNEYNGWISGFYDDLTPESFVPNNHSFHVPMIAKDFADYAEFCFETFTQIKYWGSINEAQTFAVGGNEFNWQAPGLGGVCPPFENLETGVWGDSPQGIEYRVVHNMLLAHAEANIRLDKIRIKRKTNIYFGMMNNGDFGSPLDEEQSTIEAAERRNIFWLAWCFDPIFFGDYPDIMKDKTYTGNRLPAFTITQKLKLRGSSNIMYMNTYTSKYVQDGISMYEGAPTVGWMFDSKTTDLNSKSDQYIGKVTDSSWNFIVPDSMLYLPLWYQNRYSGKSPDDNQHGKGIRYYDRVTKKYRSIPVMVTENGLAAKVDESKPLVDDDRITYYEGYLNKLGPACASSGIILIGYLAWSLCDNFEWGNGYSQQFGLCYVDIVNNNDSTTPHERILKDSANWYKKYVTDNENGPKIGFTFNTYGPTEGSDVWYYKSIVPTGGSTTSSSETNAIKGRNSRR